jgi:glycosyltransferase involved in cell wall biosynthesis
VRILFLTQWFDPEPGAIRGLPLARWLQQRGHEVQVVTGFPNYPGGRLYPGYKLRWRQREILDGISVLRVPLYPSHSNSVAGRIANFGSFAVSASTVGAALAGASDVAFVYHPPATIGLPAMVFKWFRGIPLVLHIADMWPESVTESGMLGNGWRKSVADALLQRWCSFLYRRAGAISVLSQGFKRLLIEDGVNSEKIEVIYNWADESVFRPMPRDESFARQLGLAGRFNVVYAGNFGAFQSLETLLQAAERLRDCPQIQMVLAGGGQKERKLKALAAERRLNNVRFLEARPYREMASINALADVLLVHLRDLPFLASTIPNKTQVALASGRPVLMAVRGEAAEVIERFGAGLTCEPENPEALAEAIRQLHAMPREQRENMGLRGREAYVREMSLEIGGRLTESLLLRSCSENQREHAMGLRAGS